MACFHNGMHQNTIVNWASIGQVNKCQSFSDTQPGALIQFNDRHTKTR